MEEVEEVERFFFETEKPKDGWLLSLRGRMR